MKKALSLLLAAAMCITAAVSVSAANNPKVYVNDSLIIFPDQEAEIVDDRTLVPARGVFSAMGASVQWDGETRTVQIDSDDNVTRIYLTIDDPTMKVFTFTSMFDSTENDVTLDVAPQIINDRTMIPLRAISEAMGADVNWDQDAYKVTIYTDDYTAPATSAESSTGTSTADATTAPDATEAPDATTAPDATEAPDATTAPDATEAPAASTSSETSGKPYASLVLSSDTVKVGETVDVYVNLTSIPEGSYLSSVTALVNYDPNVFEFTSSSLCEDGTEISAALGADNGTYLDGAAKIAYVPTPLSMSTVGKIAKLTFTAKAAGTAAFSLNNSYEQTRGYNVMFSVTTDGSKQTELAGTSLDVDQSDVTVTVTE